MPEPPQELRSSNSTSNNSLLPLCHNRLQQIMSDAAPICLSISCSTLSPPIHLIYRNIVGLGLQFIYDQYKTNYRESFVIPGLVLGSVWWGVWILIYWHLTKQWQNANYTCWQCFDPTFFYSSWWRCLISYCLMIS